jgi:type VI secretion system secreted protein VgrG
LRIRASFVHEKLPEEAVVRSAVVREGLSRLFTIEVDVETTDPEIDLEAFPGTNGTLNLWNELDGGIPPRNFHGFVATAALVNHREDHFVYRFTLRPGLWLLAHRVRTRLFQELNAIDIVKQVLGGAGSDEGIWDTTDVYPVREFCMQWKESELDFVSRLLEDEGIFYWFEHSDAGHELHLADHAAVHAPVEGMPSLPFVPWSRAQIESVNELVFRSNMTHDAHRTRDWNWKKPNETRDGADEPEDNAYVRYEYPGGFQENEDGGRRARNRYQEGLVRRYMVDGLTNSPRLAPGKKLGIDGMRPDAIVGEYLITQVEHRYSQGGFGSDGGGDAQQRYQAKFRATHGDHFFRPRRVTRKPRIFGVESAVVTGPAGEEIHVDEFGRIKVHFYFDRENPAVDTASFWIRFQQLNTSGAMVLPRVGWEVSIAFLDGDPDRPVAMQKVYNEETRPPYELPANHTQMALQSSSSPGAGNTNEIRMQDSNGGMDFFMHASKDFKLTAGNDMTEKITVDATETTIEELVTRVNANETIEIGADQSLSVSDDLVAEVTGNREVTIGADDDWGITNGMSFGVTGARSETISGMFNVVANHINETFNSNLTRTVGAAQSINVGTAFAEAVAGTKTELVGGAKLEIIGKTKAETVGALKTLNSGMVHVKAGKDVSFSATGAMAITALGSIKEEVTGGFTFNGKNVKVTAPGGLNLKAGSTKLVLKGTKLGLDASKFGGAGGPKLTLKGKIEYEQPGGGGSGTGGGGGAGSNGAGGSSSSQGLNPAGGGGGGGSSSAAAKGPGSNTAAKNTGVLGDFPQETQDLANKSPTLKKQLEGLDKANWTVEYGEKGKGSYCDAANKKIVIERGMTPAEEVGVIAHEAGHAYHRGDPYVSAKGIGYSEYVNRNTDRHLMDEGDAQMNRSQVRQEILNGGGPDVGYGGTQNYGDTWNRHQAGQIDRGQAQREMANHVGNERTSTTGENYRDYYGKPYKKAYIPRKVGSWFGGGG